MQPIQLNLMNLSPLKNISTFEEVSSAQNMGQDSFLDFFTNAVNNVKETQNVVDQEAYKIATGETDDVHNYNIATAKASLSLDMLIQLRNKALEAYTEVMRIPV